MGMDLDASERFTQLTAMSPISLEKGIKEIN
jgi:hypothetical protein